MSSDAPLLPEAQDKVNHHKSLKKIVVSGVGFFSDAYDLFIINIVMVILSRDFHMSTEDKSWISAAALWGAVLGQLFFGLVADKIGRKIGFVCTLSLVILGAIASALSFETAFANVFVSLAFFRFLLGIGIGGEYPLSATITAESSKAEHRGRMTALVFSMQGVGSLAAALVGFILLYSLLDVEAETGDSNNHKRLNIIWRLCLAIGAIPGLLSLYYRVTMEETQHFVNAKLAQTEPINRGPWYKRFAQGTKDTISKIRPFLKSLIGTAGTWFLFDIVFYANGLFSASIIDLFGIGKTESSSPIESPDSSNTYSSLIDISTFNIYLALIALPGYWVGVFLIELPHFGRRNTQIYGFIALALNYALIAIIYDELVKIPGLFIFFYGLSFFLCNAGPNTTTFVLPSESFPTETRATCHGLSAAAGKLGAVLGASMMAPVLNAYGIPIVLYICSGFSIIGAIFTFFFIKETRGMTLDQVALPKESDSTAYVRQEE